LTTARPVALDSEPITDSPFDLPRAEAHHLARVLRVQVGDPLRLFHGGRHWSGRVTEVQGGRVAAVVDGELEPPATLPVEVWWALPALKGGATEDLLRHLTEAGAAGFVLLNCRRSVGRHDPSKSERLRRVLVEASKQSGRAEVPELLPGGGTGPGVSLAEALHLPDRTRGVRRLLPIVAVEHLRSGPTLTALVLEWTKTGDGLNGRGCVLVATGPEGGWDSEELNQARAAGWQEATLGPLVLRAETAPLVACGAVLGAIGVA
jgi:16S rRNA (uracil1498-N3)-methyltransferase